MQKRWTSAYLKMWLSFSILVTTMMLVMMFACYAIFDRNYVRQVEEKQLGAISQIQNILNYQLVESTGAIAADVSTKSMYTDYLRLPLTNPEQTNVAIYEIYDEICSSLHSHNSDLLEQIIVYYPTLGFCISNVSGYKILDQPTSTAYRDFLTRLTKNSERRPAWLATGEESSSIVTQSTLAVSLSPLIRGIGRDSVRLILCINPSFLNAAVRSLITESQHAFLTDAEGRMIYGQPMDADEDTYARLMNPNAFGPTTMVDSAHQAVYARCQLGASGLNLIISTPIDNWHGSIHAIRWMFCLIGAGLLLISLGMVFFISGKLYAPVRILTELVRTLPAISHRQAKNEYELIQTGLEELSNLLSNNQRVLHANQSLLRNQALSDLAQGRNQQAAMETLSLLKIRFAREYYSMLAVEYCESDAAKLPLDVRQVLLVALIEVVEKRFEHQADKVYGFMPRANMACFILNYHDRAAMNLPELRQMITAFWDCYNIRSYLVETQDALTRINYLRQVYDQIQQLIASRLFDLRNLDVHTTLINGQNALPVQSALDHLESLSAGADAQDVIRILEDIASHLSQLNPEVARFYFSRCIACLQRLMLLQRPDEALPPVLSDSEYYVWKIDELPELIKEVITNPADESASDDSWFIQNVNKYIQDHLYDDVSLENISDAFHFNPKYFSRKFKKITGVSLIVYITFQRMEKAAEMLKKTELTVDVIAERAGYQSTQYFIRKFKEVYHVTPGEYRKALKVDN